MFTRVSKARIAQILFAALVVMLTFASAIQLQAQQFQQIPALSFTMPFGGGNPLPQILTVGSTGASLRYSAAAAASGGGTWLQISPAGCCAVTPGVESVNVVNAATLAVGTYTGQVTFTSGNLTMNVPVTLTVEAPSSTFFNNVPGGLTFSMKVNGNTPPAQSIPVNNGGSGTLSWTLTTSTADGGNWLTATAASGTAPDTVAIGVTPGQLPNGGAIAGTFDGQVLFHTAGNDVTVPVSVTVDPNAFVQINPISIAMPFGGGNPLPQILTLASAGTTSLRYAASAITSQGGNWLQVAPSGCCAVTPAVESAIVVNAGTLAIGTYSGQVTFNTGAEAVNVPVTLAVEPPSATFFANVPAGLTFSMKTGGTAPPAQTIPVNNGGSGTLSWTLTTSTGDGGSWLTASAASGTAPDTVAIGITPSQLPNGGTIAGTFDGQVLFHTPGNDVTVPVSVTVDANAFVQINPISFTMPFGGGNPLPEVLSLASTGTTSLRYSASAATSQGGNWLQVSPSGCCAVTPAVESAIVVNAGTLAVGTYSGQVTFTTGAEAVTVPVTLAVEPPTATFFDSVPGELTFSMKTGGLAPPAQALPIRDAGKGKLKWTVTTSTGDGGAWLIATPALGTAPKIIAVSINPKNLPGNGLIAGTFDGQLLFSGSGDEVTVPVSVTVDANAFAQINPLNFTMPFGGTNPLPQFLTLASTGTASLRYAASAATAQGGNWLQVSPSGCCAVTPGVESVNVVNAAALPVGSYSGQVTFNTGAEAVTALVTLVVEPSNKPFFDNTPGQSSFSLTTSGSGNPPSQIVPIGNGGTGTLNWTLKTTTADGNKWLKVLPTRGAAPGTATVTVTKSKLPGHGVIPGTFLGQQVFQTASGNVTVPISVTVGDPVFVEQPALTFTAKVGSNPPAQAITIASTSSSLRYAITGTSSKGGNWLQVSPNGCCAVTPAVQTVSVTSTTLAVGTYIGQVTFNTGAEAMTVPVILNITSANEEAGDPTESKP
jgi:hypothetical protein